MKTQIPQIIVSVTSGKVEKDRELKEKPYFKKDNLLWLRTYRVERNLFVLARGLDKYSIGHVSNVINVRMHMS